MFDSTLGTWSNTTVDLELKDNVKSVCSRPYPVLRVHEAMFKKEVEKLVTLRLIKHSNETQSVSPSFAKPKAKTSCV